MSLTARMIARIDGAPLRAVCASATSRFSSPSPRASATMATRRKIARADIIMILCCAADITLSLRAMRVFASAPDATPYAAAARALDMMLLRDIPLRMLPIFARFFLMPLPCLAERHYFELPPRCLMLIAAIIKRPRYCYICLICC